MFRFIGTSIALAAITAGCVTPEQAAQNQAMAAEAETVRYISPEMANDCEYLNQVSAIAGLSFFGGMEATEKTARRRLQVEALKIGGDSVRIADRMLDKGRGGADQTRLSLYGDVYKCG